MSVFSYMGEELKRRKRGGVEGSGEQIPLAQEGWMTNSPLAKEANGDRDSVKKNS